MLSLHGVNCQKLFTGTALSLNFDTFPFVDSTGRHTVTGGTLSSGANLVVAGQSSPSGGVIVTGSLKDFILGKDFDVVCTINMSTHSGADKLVWSLRDPTNASSDPYPLEVYVKNTGVVVANMAAYDNNIALFSSQTGYTIPLSTNVVVRLVKIGTALSLYCGGVLRANGTLGNPIKKTRALYIGILPGLPLSFGGTIDDFTWVNS